ncbi:DNA-processing protein DprA [Cellulosimicrobium cellulans]|uniref:DNA-processing protein DprA n=1 Tax=Cellulosimicrobium cellulans TaxID=1710 RepID=UPI0021CB0FE1|nr:DNA-processing protein DprA [Cellulosimicrobium cellulans]
MSGTGDRPGARAGADASGVSRGGASAGAERRGGPWAAGRGGRARAAERGGEAWARAAWSIVAEPGDTTAGAVVAALGAPAALAWALWAVTVTPADAVRRLRDLARSDDRAGGPVADPAAVTGGPEDGTRHRDPDGSPVGGVDPWPANVLRVLARALPRWAPRLADLDPRPALDALGEHAGVLLVPGSPAWPRGLDDLGPAAPLCLWVRGRPGLAALAARSVAVVGARAATAYGERVAGDLGVGLAERGVTVVSGGAFGVDVAAHRGALAAGGRTVALLAGGIDRPTPAGNLAVLERIVDDGGALVAESPPGTPPSRARFLQRNRVIAALTGATVVVEAAWRSGALSTAARAAELFRPVGAVPGPITSTASVGCHRLLRDGAAVCVTDATQVVELLDPPGARGPGDAGHAAAGPLTGRTAVGPPAASPGPSGSPPPAVADRADSPASRTLDALHRRRALAVPEVARRAGLAEHEVVVALGLLELAGAVRLVDGRWRRADDRSGRGGPVERDPEGQRAPPR